MSISRRDLVLAGVGLSGAAFVPRALRPATPLTFDSDPFTLGVASGYPGPSSVVLWTRLAPVPAAPDGGVPAALVPVEWEVAMDERMRRVFRRGTAYAAPDWAHSVRVEVTGLEPARSYWYRFSAGGARSPVGRTSSTAARGDSPGRLRMAVASCQMYEHGYYTAYRAMLEDDLDLIVHVGDYIYERRWGAEPVRRQPAAEARTLDDYRALYALYKRDPDLKAAHASYPWMVTWDDHEVDNDYAAEHSEQMDPPERFLARRAAAYQAYYEHMPLPRRMAPVGPHQRLYEQCAFGDLIRLFTLDGRQFRSDQACARDGRGNGRTVEGCRELFDANRTMLGRTQEAWLHGSLDASRARWHLLAQQTVMARLDQQPGEGSGYWTDGWSGYPAARERLTRVLAEQRVANPVILSGDIHAFMANNIHAGDVDTAVVASELVTTSISSQAIAQRTLDAWKPENPNMIYANSEKRGYLRLDVTRERLRADMIGVDDVTDSESGTHVRASFQVEAGRAGVQQARV